MQPIFILWTRSFWLGVFPALLVALDVAAQAVSDPTVGPPVAGVIARVFGFDPDQVEGTMRGLAPLFALIVAYQRSGMARPYTANPRARQ